MKKQLARFLGAMLTVSVLLFSCSKKDDPTMYGKWKFEGSGTIDLNGSHTTFLEFENSESGLVIEFLENGDMIFTEPNGDTDNARWKDERFPNHIVMDAVLKITKLTENEMILMNDPEQYDDYFENDKSQPYNVLGILLKRI